MAALVSLGGAFTPRPWLLALAMVWAVPALLDLVTRALGPLEDRRAQVFVDQARAATRAGTADEWSRSPVRTARRRPRITCATSCGDDEGVVASPRSFNNRAGLSRAINENLADGTRVFIAEMGTYAPGEIASLCSWCPPEIAVITAIGPVHLERMKSMSVIEQAKYEITQRAHTVIVNIDDVRLALWPELLDRDAKRVRTAGSKNAAAFVRVVASDNTWSVSVDGVAVTSIAPILGVQPTNLACAIAAALELGVEPDEVASRIQRVHGVANRSNVVTAASGVVVIDDTFNANPASAEAALTLLRSLGLGGRRVVVTPGLIELGQDQHAENLSLAQKVEASGAELVVVGRTNARALLGGYAKDARRFDTRDQAVAWVRSALVTGDGVLYLNDLPDHYP